VVRRILGQLGHAGLVSSQTGSTGGTRLSKAPSEIHLADVYHAVSCGEVFALHPKGANRDCPVGRNIEAVLCNLQKEIDRAVGQKLAEYTLDDVLVRIESAAA
jgi:DNA-binding IscR family transcriptional regulator